MTALTALTADSAGLHIGVIAGAGIRLHKVGVIVNALPTSTVHPGCTVDLGSNNTALVIVSHASIAASVNLLLSIQSAGE